MNFKEKYRAANDEIHGDRSILAGITDAKPKKIIYFKPVLGAAVAAVVCVVAIALYPYIGVKPSADKETPTKVSPDIFVDSEQTEGMTVPIDLPPLSLTEETDSENLPETEAAPASGNQKKASAPQETAADTAAATTDAIPAENTAAAQPEETQPVPPKTSVPDKPATNSGIHTILPKQQCPVCGSLAHTDHPPAPPVFDDDIIDLEPSSDAEPIMGFGPDDGGGTSGGGGSSSAKKSVRYTLSPDGSYVSAYDADGKETRYTVTESTVFITSDGETVEVEELESIEITHIETKEGFVVKVFVKRV